MSVLPNDYLTEENLIKKIICRELGISVVVKCQFNVFQKKNSLRTKI